MTNVKNTISWHLAFITCFHPLVSLHKDDIAARLPLYISLNYDHPPNHVPPRTKANHKVAFKCRSLRVPSPPVSIDITQGVVNGKHDTGPFADGPTGQQFEHTNYFRRMLAVFFTWLKHGTKAEHRRRAL